MKTEYYIEVRKGDDGRYIYEAYRRVSDSPEWWLDKAGRSHVTRDYTPCRTKWGAKRYARKRLLGPSKAPKASDVLFLTVE